MADIPSGGAYASPFKIGSGSLDASGLSAGRTYNLPDASGTLALDDSPGYADYAMNILMNPFRHIPRNAARNTLQGYATGGYAPACWFLQHDAAGSGVQVRVWNAKDSSPPISFTGLGCPDYLELKNNTAGPVGVLLCQPIESAGPAGLSSVSLQSKDVRFQMTAAASSGSPTLKSQMFSWTGTPDAAGARNLVASWVAHAPTFNTTTLTALGVGTASLSTSFALAVDQSLSPTPSTCVNLTCAVWVEGLASGASLYLAKPYLARGTAAPTVWQPHPAADALLRRYCAWSFSGVDAGAGSAPGTPSCSMYYCHPTASFASSVQFGMLMRTAPTVTLYDGAGNSGKVSYNDGTWKNNGAVALQTGFPAGLIVQSTVTGATFTNFDWLATAEI